MAIDEKDILRQLADPTTKRKAFELIVNKYGESLYWKIRHIVLNHDDADDVLQNTFIKAWVNLAEFKQLSKISTWLYRIAINESLDFIRKRKANGDRAFRYSVFLGKLRPCSTPVYLHVCSVAQSCPTLCNPMDFSPPRLLCP